MVDSPCAMKKTISVPEIKPLDQYDINRAKTRSSIRWLLLKFYGGAENVPVELRDPLYKDQYEQEHLKPAVSALLLTPKTYCRVQALLTQGQGVSQSASQPSPTDISSLLQFLIKKGFTPKNQDVDVMEEDICSTPIKTKAHLALIDSLMSLDAKETVGRVKIAATAEQMGVLSPWENALLFWVNRLNQKLRESIEEEEEEEVPPNANTCTDMQSAKEMSQSSRWYWKLVPHAIAFCLKESGNKPPVIRYRKDKVLSKLTPTFPLVSGIKDLSNGCAVAAVLHYYCPDLLPLQDVCLKDTMSVADSLYNLQLIKEFCQSSLQNCCLLAMEDMLYAPPTLHDQSMCVFVSLSQSVGRVMDRGFLLEEHRHTHTNSRINLLNIMSFMAALLDWFEVKKPDFVKPLLPIDLTDVSGLLDCTSPVSGNSNSGSPSFIFKQPFVPISSPVSAENKSCNKKQSSRPLSAVTFSIPFGLDSDVDIVMGNPIDSVFRSVSTDSLATGIPAMTSAGISQGMTRVPYSPPEDLSHLISTSAPLHRSSWGPYTHTAPLGELPTIEEALQVGYIPASKDRRKERAAEKTGQGVVVGKQELRLRPEGAPAGFFLHSPGEDCPQLSSSAPSRTGILHQLEQSDKQRQGRGKSRKSGGNSDMSRDDDSVLRDGSVDSSEASDDACRNAPGNMRPSNGHQGNHSTSSSPRMTSFAERRDNRRRHPAAPGEESSAPTTPGTPQTPSSPAGVSGRQSSPGPSGPEPGSEAWKLGARLEEKRKSIEAQKRRIEAIFVKHRQRLGKTAFLKLQKEQGEGEGQDNLTLEERLTCVEEQLKQEEEKEQTEKPAEKEKDKPSVSNPSRLEKQVTFSIESKKGGEKEQESEKKGETVIVEYNDVVQKLSEALQSLQKDMQKLTEQQQELMSNQRPKNTTKTSIKNKTPPHTPTKTPPRTPTKTSTRTTSKAWMIPAGANQPPVFSPSRRSNTLPSSTSPKISSSCPAPRTKIHISSTPRSPKTNSRPQHLLHPRPSELKFPPCSRVLMPTQNVDTLPHLRRVSPSKCQVQTSSSFSIGGLKTPHQYPQPTQQPQLEESTSDTGSSETPTQFSLELDQEDVDAVGGLPVLVQPRQEYPRAAGSSSGAPSECSFDSETLSMSAAFSTVADEERGAEKLRSLNEASLLSPGPDGASCEPTDEGQEFSSDSMSDRTESGPELARKVPAEVLDSTEISKLPTEVRHLPEQESETSAEHTKQTETEEPKEDENEAGIRGAIGFFIQEEAHGKGEMAQRKAMLLERQQKRAEDIRKRKQWHEQERENSPVSADNRVASLANTPPVSMTSPSPTPPATPARRGDFTRGEYALRQQLRIMDDLDKVLNQKTASSVQKSAKKVRSRPRSMTREETKLSLSPAKAAPGSKLNKVYSHSSLNLAATGESGGNGSDSPKKTYSKRPDSPSLCRTPSRLASSNGGKDGDTGSTGNSPAPEYTGPKLFKEPSFKSNKFIIHNALSRCCLAGKVNEAQKKKIVEEMEKSPANHFLILFRDSNCQFRGVYTMTPDSEDMVRLAGVGPRTVSSSQVESIYKYSSDRKQFSTILSKTMGMSVDAFTIPGHLWQGGGGGGGGGAGGGGSRRASITKKAVPSKATPV